MKRTNIFAAVRAGFLGCFLCAFATQLSAQATRTWVSGVGDDVNPCSRTAPCKTFAGAISKTAAGGEIDALDPGGFGTLTITKAITIDGGGGIVASALGSNTNGIAISAGSTDFIVLRNLSINGAGTAPGSDTRGIEFLSGAKLVVENCDISNFGKRGISIESSTPGAQVVVINSTVHGNLTNGVVVSPPGVTNTVTFDHVRLVNNTFYGIGVSAGGVVHIRNSVVSENSGGGLLVDNSTADVTATSITNNGYGITSQDSGMVRIGLSTITGNTINALSIAPGATIASYGDNYLAGAGAGLTFISKQ
jgi:Right handed beta helix region